MIGCAGAGYVERPTGTKFGEVQRMQNELNLALRSKDRKWVMVIDARKCIGCNSCTVSCAAENVTPPSGSYRRVFETYFSTYPDAERFFMPANCQQCDNPACKNAADKIAAGLIEKRKDGIVIFHYDKQKKNQKAMAAAKNACPYYAIVEDNGTFYTDGTPEIMPYEKREFFDADGSFTRKNRGLNGLSRKCHFCVHRINSGMLPACVTTCMGRAMYFGNIQDSGSLVSELIQNNQTKNIKPENKPSIYYIGMKSRKAFIPASEETCNACHS